MLGTIISLLETSSFAAAMAVLDRVLGLLAGGLPESTEVVAFLCFAPAGICAVESSASSPEASLEDGCSRSVVEEFVTVAGRSLFLFLLPELRDDGDDIALRSLVRQL